MNVPGAARLGRVWNEPGAVATIVLGVLLLGFALSVRFPVVAFGFQSDESTYYSLGHSIAADRDMQFQRKDLVRVWREFPSGPEGIFLKRGRSVTIEFQGRPPFVKWVKGTDPRADRLYYGKSFIYPLAAAPFIMLVGTNGFLVLHALLLTACFGAVYAFVRARATASAALGYAVVFLFASAAPVYFVWLTPELFNLSFVLLGLFLWAYKEVAPAAAQTGTWLDRWGAFVRSPWSDIVACVLLGVATFSKPLNVFAAAPLLLLALWRRQWWRVAGICVAFLVATGGLFLANGISSGDMNYQGGGPDRSTFYGRFPFQSPDLTFDTTGEKRATDGLLTEVIFNTDALTTVLRHNIVYFFLGRHTGLVPYFFPGVLTLVLFLVAGRQRREPFQWLLVGTLAVASVAILIYMPFTYSGGGGPIGNRYFLGYYALFAFLVPAAITVRTAVVAAAVGGLFTAQLIANPFYSSFRPETHAKYGLFRWLPIELSLVNDMPINVTPSRAKQTLAGDPAVWAYFLDDNAYGREGEWFWVRGESRADLILRAPARPHADGAFTSLALTALDIEVATGAAPAVVTIDTGAARVHVTPGANNSETVRVPMPGGFPYKAVPGQPLNRVYAISIAASEGFVPLFAEGVRDSRFLGARIRIAPLYRDDRYQPPPKP
ncbi:MAG: hypothetical protein IT182_08970 [Acidobacteria bacterium]|nr:hypothetical protein [Acidobacteriota bacterium]